MSPEPSSANAHEATGQLAELYSVEPHKRADLILIDGDPAQNVSDIRHISLVMKDGVVYFPAQVYESVGVKRFADLPPIHRDAVARPPGVVGELGCVLPIA